MSALRWTNVAGSHDERGAEAIGDEVPPDHPDLIDSEVTEDEEEGDPSYDEDGRLDL